VTLLATPHAAGSAYLTFTRSGSETVLTRVFATSPAKLIASKGRGETCWVYAATLGGGLVGGDEIHIRANVTAGARALMTTQASTKVYRSLTLAQSFMRMSPTRCLRYADRSSVRQRGLYAGNDTTCTPPRASCWWTAHIRAPRDGRAVAFTRTRAVSTSGAGRSECFRRLVLEPASTPS
jgi:urease accessory protein